MNHVSQRPSDLVSLHRQAVIRTLAELLELQDVRGAPTAETVGHVYDSLSDGDHAVLLHQEPFDTACDIADIGFAQRQAIFDRIRHPYDAMMEEIDDLADALEARPGPEHQATRFPS